MEKRDSLLFKKKIVEKLQASTSVLLMALWAAVLGAVHTRCSGTRAWVLAQNVVVFTL